MRRFSICLVLISAIQSPTFASKASSQSITVGGISWSAIDNKCSIGSRKSLNAEALARKNQAVIEWGYFGNQRINHRGNITKFGGSEAENNENDAESGDFVEQAPWRNVFRYWRISNGSVEGALKELKTTSRAASINASTGANLGSSDEFKVSDSINTIKNLNTEYERMISQNNAAANFTLTPAQILNLNQSVIRASVVDVAWSAAFISSMHVYSVNQSNSSNVDALTRPSNFRLSTAHRNYMKDSFWTSVTEQGGSARQDAVADYTYNPRYDMYRACDPSKTKPRVGDMLCSARMTTLPVPISSTPFRVYGSNLIGDRPFSASHCDIVVEINEKSKKVEVIGGNVNQSVTRRTLNLNENLFLSPSQSTSTTRDETRCESQENCDINRRSWFVLMQMR